MPRLSAMLLLALLTWTATAGALTLTDEERSWLKTHPELRLGVDASWPPFEYRDEEGRYQGLAADYIHLIQERLSVNLKPVEPASWTAVLEDAKQGKLDLLPGIMSTPNARATWPSPGLTWTSPSSSSPMKAARNPTTSRNCTVSR